MREIKLTWLELGEILKKAGRLLVDSDNPKEGNEFVENITPIKNKQLLVRIGKK